MRGKTLRIVLAGVAVAGAAFISFRIAAQSPSKKQIDERISSVDLVDRAEFELASAVADLREALDHEHVEQLTDSQKSIATSTLNSAIIALDEAISFVAPPNPKLTIKGGSVDFELSPAEDDFSNIADHLVKVTFKKQVGMIRVYAPPASTGDQSFEHDDTITNNWAITLTFRDVNGNLEPNSTMMICSSPSCLVDGNQVASSDVYLVDDSGKHGKFKKTSVRNMRYDRLSPDYCSNVSRCNHIAQITVATAPSPAIPFTQGCPTTGPNDGKCYVYLYKDK